MTVQERIVRRSKKLDWVNRGSRDSNHWADDERPNRGFLW